MKNISVIRYETKPEASEENQRLVEQIFAELNAKDPGGIRYTTVRLPDEVGFIHIFISETDEDILGEIPFQKFAEGAADRMIGPPDVNHGSVIGSYRFPAT
jgi:quinol monooxygenase YgiN